jgi:hypothetical protein
MKTVRRFAFLLFVLILSSAPAAAQTGTPLSLQSANWMVISEGSVPLASSAFGLSLDIPSVQKSNMDSDSVNALWTNYLLSPIVEGLYLTVDLQIMTTGAPIFNHVLESGNTCGGRAYVRPWFARKGWQSGGEFHRWWSSPIAYALRKGSTTLKVPLSLDKWSSVFGKFGTYNSAASDGFFNALRDLGQMGLVFGGGCFFGHGVNVSGGTAKFIMTNYIIWR